MNDHSPRVSIGLPVFNGEKFLRQSLDSILTQTFTDFELVISDNASTDQTQDICLSYTLCDYRVRYFRNEENLGAAPNHNRVFRLSRGEYFKWAGYDDLVAPEFLAKCVEILDQNPEVVLCMPKSAIIDDSGIYLGEYEYKADVNSPKPYVRFRDFVLNPDNGNQTYGLMRVDTIRKTALHGSFPASDLVFLAEMALYGKFYVISSPLFFRRYHSQQSTKGVLEVERNRVSWFDTSKAGKILLPKWQIFFAYIQVIQRVPLGWCERVHCYVTVIRWILIPSHFRALGKDVLLAVQQVLIRSFLRLKTQYKLF